MRLRSVTAAVVSMFIATTTVAQDYNPTGGHIISCAPIEVCGNGYGSGLSWEHFLGHEDWLSFIVPITVTVNPEQGNNVGHMFYVNPGLKLYTNMRSYRRAKVSIGPSLFMGAGRGRQNDYSFPFYGEQSRFMYGAMLNLGLNWFPTNHIYLGVDYGLGITSVNKYDGVNTGISFLNRVSFKIGYMFKTRQPIRQETEPISEDRNN